MFKLAAKIAAIPDGQGSRARYAYPSHIGNSAFFKLFAENMMLFF